METIIKMRRDQNWAGDKYLGFYDGNKLIGEVDPRDGSYHVFYGFNRPSLIGIHADEGRAIKHLQSAIKAAFWGRVKFYRA